MAEEGGNELWALGHAAWPELHLEEEVFRGHVAGHSGEPVPLDHAGDLYLACACAYGVPGALGAFERTFADDIARAIRRLGAGSNDDLGQVVRQKLFTDEGDGPKIAQYSGRARLRHWLRVVVARTVQNSRRKRVEAPVTDSHVNALVADALTPEAMLIEGTLVREYKAAFEDAFRALEPQERMLLRFSVVDGLGIDDIAAILKVHRATAARRVAAARVKLGDLTKATVIERGRLSPDEFESAVRVIRSQLQLSLQRVFAADA
jgi:RNA polymerase sigma-70 factor (ECF subfamily)